MNRDWVLFNLREAEEELRRTISEIESTPDYDCGEFVAAMGHTYHHLNTAWNSRDEAEAVVREWSNDRETKAFLEREARKIDPAFKPRSGARYRLNRWRDAQLTRGAPITYRDLVKEYVRLNHPEATHRRAPVDRYVYFLSDFMEANPGATMAAAIRAWKTVKTMDSPKNYRAFARTRDSF